MVKVRRPTCLYIMRGLPGSGKSTYAKTLGIPIVSADDFFVVDGEYLFNPRQIGLAHGQCFRRALTLAIMGDSFCVDNTNTTTIEVAPYVAMAQAYGMKAKILTVKCPFDIAYARQTHGVPRETCISMLTRMALFEPPPWWNCESLPSARARALLKARGVVRGRRGLRGYSTSGAEDRAKSWSNKRWGSTSGTRWGSTSGR